MPGDDRRGKRGQPPDADHIGSLPAQAQAGGGQIPKAAGWTDGSGSGFKFRADLAGKHLVQSASLFIGPWAEQMQDIRHVPLT
jgi:hypothetical protein